MKTTRRVLLQEGAERLRAAGVTEAELDARYLLLEAFHTDFTHFLIEQNQELEEIEPVKLSIEHYWSYINRREERVPLQQILGSTVFMGLEFMVNEHVLIPRQDTETLVEKVLQDYKGQAPHILDLCTGSGCIAVSLAVLGKFQHVVATDISKEALCVAKRNGELLAGGNVAFILSDMFENLRLSGQPGSVEQKFDVIVSNPPYIPTEVIKGLEPEVKSYEPMLALDGQEDGLYFYRRLSAEMKSFLNPGGAVYLEIGFDQGEAVSRLLEEAGFCHIEVIKDEPGLDRVVRGDLK